MVSLTLSVSLPSDAQASDLLDDPVHRGRACRGTSRAESRSSEVVVDAVLADLASRSSIGARAFVARLATPRLLICWILSSIAVVLVVVLVVQNLARLRSWLPSCSLT